MLETLLLIYNTVFFVIRDVAKQYYWDTEHCQKWR